MRCHACVTVEYHHRTRTAARWATRDPALPPDRSPRPCPAKESRKREVRGLRREERGRGVEHRRGVGHLVAIGLLDQHRLLLECTRLRWCREVDRSVDVASRVLLGDAETLREDEVRLVAVHEGDAPTRLEQLRGDRERGRVDTTQDATLQRLRTSRTVTVLVLVVLGHLAGLAEVLEGPLAGD